MRDRTGTRGFALVAVLGVAGLASCGGGAGGEARAVPDSVAVAQRAPVDSTSPTAQPAPSPVDHLVGVGDARQVVAVVADDYGQATATFTAYERDDNGWREVFGPWRADIGTNGFAPPEEKREGDGRTPTGTYAFDFLFGVLGDPGVRFPYRDVTSTAIVWDDDPTSTRYNLWTDTATQSAGTDPEPMYNVPVYNYGAVIAYNATRTPGLGSAIFLHVSKGSPTAGCVAVPQSDLVDVLRWLDPQLRPRIVMGTRAAVAP